MRNFFGGSPFGGKLGDHSFHYVDSTPEAPPTERCNPAWDPGCPRTFPTRTMVPYVPSSYEMGVVYAALWRRARPKDRSGRFR